MDLLTSASFCAQADLAKSKNKILYLEKQLARFADDAPLVSDKASAFSAAELKASISVGSMDRSAVAPARSEDSVAGSSNADGIPVTASEGNNSVGDSNNYLPESSWVRNYLANAALTSNKIVDPMDAPKSIAERFGDLQDSELSERGSRNLKAVLERLGRDTTLNVVSGVYPASAYAPSSDLNHWDTLVMQMESKKRSGSPQSREHILHQALRKNAPSPTERMSMNSKGDVSIIHRVFEQEERKRLGRSALSPQDKAERSKNRSRPDYMSPTVVSQSKEKPTVAHPITAARGSSRFY